MLVKIECPECNSEGNISMVESNYQGPYRCWKCSKLFTIKMKDNKLESCEPLSQEEFDKQREIEALKAKFKRQ